MPTTIRSADRSTLATWDGLVLFWVLLWAVLGVWTGWTIWRAADVGDTISSSGQALHSVGGGLQGLANVPVVGDRPGKIGDEVVTTSTDIIQRGQHVKGQLHRLGILLGIAVVGIPVTPVVGLYLPLRATRRKDAARMREQLRSHADDPGLDRYLAHRARVLLPYDEVARLDPGLTGTAGGSGDGEDRDTVRRLADAELARIGVRRPGRD